jgi:MOSC domain-containing protein YiiM
LRNPCVQWDHSQSGSLAARLERDEDEALIREAGVMALVLANGEVRTGDPISVELPPELHRHMSRSQARSEEQQICVHRSRFPLRQSGRWRLF